MAGAGQQAESVQFSGTRREMGALLLRGYGLLLPTIGLYRFWLITWKRRFYWAHTEIDGDPLEYTGNASQLLFGFLMAVAVFVPLYGLFFYLSTLSSEAAMVGYGGVGVLIWFLMGYAIYRARDFRLSRTLWRGVRFDQGGSAWTYALRRFGWSLLVFASAGLAYPFMAANLWAYRYRHSWYGDRSFSFSGNWKQLAGPYYRAYGTVVVIGMATISIAASMGAFPDSGSPDPASYISLAIGAALIWLVHLTYRARELTRMFSAVRLGDAALSVHVRARSLIGQYLLFALALLGLYLLLAIGGLVVLATLAGGAFAGGSFDPSVFMVYLQSSLLVVVAIILGYLLLLGAFSLAAELCLNLGFWKLVANSASITRIDTLASVRARGEDKTLVGEGLADALNVGAY